jgi:putative membrane protein
MVELKRQKDGDSDVGLFNLIGRLVVNIIALLIVAYIIPGFVITNLQTAVVAAIVIGVINTFIRPVLQIIALPFSILTLGIVAFLINVGLLMSAAAIVPGFEIDGFLTAVVSSIALALVSSFLHKLTR